MSSSRWAEAVAEFAARNGYPPPAGPTAIEPRLQVLRLRLMIEELGELAIAMHEGNLEKIADGVCDALYTVVGTAVAYGFGPILHHLFEEVHRSNLTKLPAEGADAVLGVKYQAKAGKGPGYSPPRIGELLDDYRDALRRIDEAGRNSDPWCRGVCLPQTCPMMPSPHAHRCTKLKGHDGACDFLCGALSGKIAD